jgi:transposase
VADVGYRVHNYLMWLAAQQPLVYQDDTSARVLALRDAALAPMLWMSDALAANTPKRHGERVVDLNCLVHARRQFVDIKDFFPSECEHLIAAIATVYHHEAQCVEAELSPTQRLTAHQTHSAPVMDALKGWMEQQFADKQVEPNSRLGQALNYMLKRWEALTGFLRIPGAPLDNNTAYAARGISEIMPRP